MTKIAPHIKRQRLLVEGFYTIPVDEAAIRDFFKAFTNHMEFRVYGEAVIFQPESGMGRDANAGFDAFIPLIDSGISAYFWSKETFLSIVVYTCKDFSEKKAHAYIKEYFALEDNSVSQSF